MRIIFTPFPVRSLKPQNASHYALCPSWPFAYPADTPSLPPFCCRAYVTNQLTWINPCISFWGVAHRPRMS